MPPKRKEGARRSVGEVAVVDWRFENSGRKREESEAWSASPRRLWTRRKRAKRRSCFWMMSGHWAVSLVKEVVSEDMTRGQ